MEKHTSLIEEIASSVTHGLGLLLVIIGVVLLIFINIHTFEFWRMFGLGIFGLSVILTYTFSTLYHGLYFTKANSVFKRLDHSSIFLLIAGTYTPFILISVRNLNGLILLLFLWLLTISGIVFKAIFVKKWERLLVFIYILLGWIGVFIFEPISNAMPQQLILLLILGGCFYTFGTIFYFWKTLKFNHGIWHLFVLSGTTCHFLALLQL